jgi:hypothetical protein
MINLMRIIKLGALLGLSLAASSVYALTPGNTSLTNSAKLTYDGNTDGISASVTVTVDTIGATPDGSTLLNVSKAENQPFTSEVFTLTANNNGPDDYTVAITATVPIGATNADTEVFQLFANSNGVLGGSAITSVNLGATAMQEASASAVIKVPHDGSSTGDSVVNGLQATDKVVINLITYTISAVDEITDTDFVSITLNASLPTSLPIGTAVQEAKDFYVISDNVGSRFDPLNATSLEVAINVTPTLSGAVAFGLTFQVAIVRVNVKKYVSNISDPNASAACADSITINPVIYHLAGGPCVVNANSTNTLAYLIRVITPNETGAELVNAVIEDVLPPFTAYVASTTTLNGQAVTDALGGGPAFPLDSATGGSDTIPGMLIQDATVPQASGAQGDGNVEINSTVDVVYQVTLQ